MPTDPIRVEGLKDLTRELRKADRDFPKQIRLVNLRIATDVANEARSGATSLGGVAAKAAPSIRALAQQSRAQVKLGSDRYPYALGAEFGSLRFRQFKAWRGSGQSAGYFLYPAIRKESPQIIASYSRMVADVTRAAFPR